MFASSRDIRQEESGIWNLSWLGDCPLCMESLMNLSLVVSIISESGLKKLQLIFLKTTGHTNVWSYQPGERFTFCKKGVVVWARVETALCP